MMKESENDTVQTSQYGGLHSDENVEGPDNREKVEGLDAVGESWGDYPLKDVLIRHETRTIHETIRRIKQGNYVMDPDFQRDFIWKEDKQSKLIESVIMRIPLPVFYLAEDDEGRMVVVDGLQRLSTFKRFVEDGFRLKLPNRDDLNGKQFSELPPIFQNRIEDCNLILYIMDSQVPERARLDIFDRVNSGVALSRQQMRNSLFMGKATRFLKAEARSKIFIKATGDSLNQDTMRDREFINRFCAFQILGVDKYYGDMDSFLSKCLRHMNNMENTDLDILSAELRRGLKNNLLLFNRHSFRKSLRDRTKRSVLNASFWDVMSTGLSRYNEELVQDRAKKVQESIRGILRDPAFDAAITLGTNGSVQVQTRFKMVKKLFQEVLGDYTD